jgi:hypothetical protein
MALVKKPVLIAYRTRLFTSVSDLASSVSEREVQQRWECENVLFVASAEFHQEVGESGCGEDIGHYTDAECCCPERFQSRDFEDTRESESGDVG